MKNKNFLRIFILIVFSIINNFANANEIYFEGSVVEFLKNKNEIIGKKGVKITTDNNIEIIADNFNYNKNTFILVAQGNILINDFDNNLKIRSDKITYLKNEQKILSDTDTFINLSNNYFINTKNFEYDKNQNTINSNSQTKVVDTFNNNLELSDFNFDILKKILKSKKIKLNDNQGNEHLLNQTMLNLLTDEMAGKDIKINFRNDIFNKKENEPRLKGNSFFSDKNETKIKKGIFTTCKKNDDCPPWVIKAEEVRHDKNNKTINYKNAWLQLYDVPVFYFPKFFHPDPTVKRQSGFLIPQITSSSSLGSNLKIPYFKVISDNKDLTISPRIYFNQDILVQTEYRQVNKKSENIFDFSFKSYNEKSSTKSHFFSNSSINLGLSGFDESNLDIQIQQTSNNNYLKSHKIKSPLINSFTTLKNIISFTGSTDRVSLEGNLEVYEDLSKVKNNDKYEFIPNYRFSQIFEDIGDLAGNFSFSSFGNRKLFKTNVLETTVVNDLAYNSNSFLLDNGLTNNYSLLLKNVLSDSKNSASYKEEFESKLYSQFQYQSSYPLIKVGSNTDSILSPKVSFMYSPNNTKDYTVKKRRIDINNIYSSNRIAINETVEGGESLTIGTEYELINKKGDDLLSIDLGTVLRKNKNQHLPKSSKIGERLSDIVGNLKIKPSKSLNLNYDFSMDNSLDRFNFNFLELDLNVNNFVTSFEFLEENNEIGTESYFSSKLGYNFDSNNSINFATRRNRKTNLTEFYNLMYQYENDCLVAAIEYNKDYYSDTDLSPGEEIFFSLTIMPFSKFNSPNIQK
ncbi:organic solvent tolerance protein [Candidatus Pelagibacter sp.]|nr:organic solvent tolerance protein [Candidatus Pelagibacter sp.]